MERRSSLRALLAATLGVATLVACTTVPNRDVVTAGSSQAGAPGASTTVLAGNPGLTCPAGTGDGSPGVSANEVRIGAISTLSGPIAADFADFVPGMQAYLDEINAHGGVNGRKIVMADNLDDGGNATQFTSLTHTAIDSDHLFAVGISSFFFTPTYFVQTCTPTYGYNVTGNWANQPNLFAAGGSVQAYQNLVPFVAYMMHQLHLKSIALLAYEVPSSYDACKAVAQGLRAAHVTVSYEDYGLSPINADLTPDVQRIKSAGADFVVSCMDVNGNISLSRGLQEYGIGNVKQLWFNGNDQDLLDQYPNLMKGVYFFLGHVPFAAAQLFPGTYPGLTKYLQTMKKYEPKYVYDETAVDGWMSAALLVDGIRAAGRNPTQAKVVAQTNRFRDFTADGLTTPVNWATGHTQVANFTCGALVQVRGKTFEPVFTQGKQVFTCTNENVRNPTRIPVPKGTPGP